ncbi:low temperature requirement protein A [Plantactinospora endophytica]|uniref:Membrane protein n=1 Tax=Plantactinospora endophytica TaxID=673535 RepID=A0ABQ4DV75_9ACTN|nr:low temperature requirement protein A [Plantactinospora endophytica]GIG86368.1 membrane protein [Plantactinospora endophytica]
MAEGRRPERSGPARLLRQREHSRQASFLELFFDLAFIVSFTLLSTRLVGDLDWRNTGQTLILLAAIWWLWVATAWSTDWFNPNEPLIRLLVVSIMFVGLVASAAIPEAYGRHGLLFAGAYVLVHLGRAALLLPALRGHPIQRRSMLVAVWFTVSAVPWMAGAVLTGAAREILWLVAILMDYFIASQGWPVPWLGRLQPAQLRVVGEHLSERYQQIYIVALGEIILVGGLTYAREGAGLTQTVALALAFGNAGLMLWMYFVPVGGRLSGAIERNQPRGAVYAAYFHAIMIAGTVHTAVGAELMIMHPLDETRASWSLTIVAGAVLFLVGRTLMGRLVYAHPIRRSVAALVLLLAAVPGLVRLPPLAVGAVTFTVLFCVLVVYVYLPSRNERVARRREARRQERETEQEERDVEREERAAEREERETERQEDEDERR